MQGSPLGTEACMVGLGLWSGEAQGMCNGLLNRLMPSIEVRFLLTPNIGGNYDFEVQNSRMEI